MNLINHEDNISLPADIFNKPLHTAFELPSELSAGNQRRQIQQKDFLALQFYRDVSGSNTLGKPFCDSSFSNARLPDQTGVVFLPAVQNLYNALNFFFAPDDRVKFALFGAFRQTDTVIVEKLPSGGTGFRAFAVLFGRGRGGGVAVAVGVRVQAIHKGECGGVTLFLLFVVLVVAVLLLGIVVVLHVLHGGEHIRAEDFQIIVGNPHSFHHLVDLRQADFPRTAQAQSLTGCLVALQFRDENHGDIFLTSTAKSWLHCNLPRRRPPPMII